MTQFGIKLESAAPEADAFTTWPFELLTNLQCAYISLCGFTKQTILYLPVYWLLSSLHL